MIQVVHAIENSHRTQESDENSSFFFGTSRLFSLPVHDVRNLRVGNELHYWPRLLESPQSSVKPLLVDTFFVISNQTIYITSPMPFSLFIWTFLSRSSVCYLRL